MMRIMIFSGTTEGRRLSELLAGEGISHHVCVASDYGNSMIREREHVCVHIGRLDAEQMIELLKAENFDEGDVVVDATHPYASEVSANIKTAAERLGLKLIRVVRPASISDDKSICSYESITQCAEAVDESEGGILLTTGSKELRAYADAVSSETLQRTYVRVLPSKESIALCEENGIVSDHIIAMHGPFLTELNSALIRQYGIKHLVTKESGTAGGFDEKLEAAAQCGTNVYVIRRPLQEKGVSTEQAFAMITGKQIEEQNPLMISLCGIGPGGRKLLTEEVKQLTDEADACFGAKRIIADIDSGRKYPYYLAADIARVLKSELGIKKAAVLFSGDSSFYSGAKKAYDELVTEFPDAGIDICPGISSVSCLAAKNGVSYEDAKICSLHGRMSETSVYELVKTIESNRKTFFLVSGSEDVRTVCESLLSMGINARLTVGVNLSLEGERIESFAPEKGISFEAEGPITVLAINDDYRNKPLIDIKRDEDFIRDKVPMTKECIRHESVIRLGLKKGDVLYDIGSGTGSVAIEAAGLDSTVKVYAIEKKDEACTLTERNKSLHNAVNVKLIRGEAPGCLDEISEAPDCVFIGGSSGKIGEILDAVKSKSDHSVRVVVNTVSLETEQEMWLILKERDIEAEIVRIAVSTAEKVGSHHLMKAANPVTIYSFEI